MEIIDIVYNFVSYLHYKDIIRLSRVCKLYNKIISDNNLWLLLIKRDYPTANRKKKENITYKERYKILYEYTIYEKDIDTQIKENYIESNIFIEKNHIYCKLKDTSYIKYGKDKWLWKPNYYDWLYEEVELCINKSDDDCEDPYITIELDQNEYCYIDEKKSLEYFDIFHDIIDSLITTDIFNEESWGSDYIMKNIRSSNLIKFHSVMYNNLKKKR